MRFGGHETFSIRDGWLHRGLKLLVEEPDKLHDEYAADWLGVGRNMAKSIRHWLLASGLADKDEERSLKRSKGLVVSPLGSLVYESDPYFSELGTWWLVHANLVNNSEHAYSWSWFFNNFNATRFEKPVCMETLRRFIQLSNLRQPTPRTLDRDVTCLLRTYAELVPREHEDPEEALDCPLSELGLLRYYRSSGYYQLNQDVKRVPTHLLCYTLAVAAEETRSGSRYHEIFLADAARIPGGPGRVFALTSESLFETVSLAEQVTDGEIEIVGLAGDRVIRIPQRPAHAWLEQFYADAAREEVYAT